MAGRPRAAPGRAVTAPENAQAVGADRSGRVIVALPRALMTRDQALAHAAWLVAVCKGEDEFPALLDQVLGASGTAGSPPAAEGTA